jgi:thiopeptide-type bacteriocin biosynthesis protein
VLTPSYSWLAFHVFLADPVRSERFLCDRIHPLVRDVLGRSAAEGWFFVRYWEGGPHLRVRLRGLAAGERNGLIARLSDGIGAWTSDNPPTREAYYGAHPLDGQPVDRDALPWFPEGTVRTFDYEPESQRYGGVEATAASERQFEHSSNIAMSIIRGTPGDMSKRLALSFMLMAETVLAYRRDARVLSVFFRSYAEFWSRYSGQTRAVWAQASQGTPNPKNVQALKQQIDGTAGPAGGRSLREVWGEGLRRLLGELSALRDHGKLRSPLDGKVVSSPEDMEAAVLNILSSQLHMLNNRLGIVPAQELLLAAELGAAARFMEPELAGRREPA